MTTLTNLEIERMKRRMQRAQEKADKEALFLKNVTVLKKRLKAQKKGWYLKGLNSAKMLAKI